MIYKGYSLNEMEILNWGNFHGYQKFSLRRMQEGGELFAPRQASAVLGVNGSGKTTLIDALMIALLPFENSVKLGVTNDYEMGSGGGRTIRDYVLGKYSSQTEVVSDLSSVYGRKSGVSILLLKFQHNENPKKFVSLGRVWWYSQYKVSDTQLGFVSLDNLNLSVFCPNNEIPKSPKVFKQYSKEVDCEVQVFETMQSYFSALSGALGGLKRDDLKLLNRSFYVKSISQIDSFIKENMLLSYENPHLDRLMENVKNGQEIALAIETCEKKLNSITKVLKELDRIKKDESEIKKIQLERSLLDLLPDFIEINKFKQKLIDDKKLIEELGNQKPGLLRQIESLEIELATIRSQLSSHQAIQQLELIEKQIEHIQEKIDWSNKLVKKWTPKLKRMNVSFNPEKVLKDTFISQLKSTLNGLTQDLVIKREDLELKRRENFDLEKKSQKLKTEVEHLTQTGSLIPRRVYDIKLQAINELKIPQQDLRFFAELVQIKANYSDFKKSVEAVFFGISRNLLCHPNHLNKLTKWLDKNGLKSDVTVKRISVEELEKKSEPFPQGENSILNFIEILPSTDHPFFNYIENWCIDCFNYKLVSVTEFKSAHGKLVTAEGLIKKDLRTMRKLKSNFSYSLGWDTENTISEKSKQLVQWGGLYQKQREEILEIESKVNQLVLFEQEIKELITNDDFIDLLCSGKSLIETKMQMMSLLKELNEKTPEVEVLKNKLDNLLKSEKVLRQKIASMDHQSIECIKRVKDTECILPVREQSFNESSLFLSFVKIYKTQDAVSLLLKHKEEELVKIGKTRLELSSEYTQAINSWEEKINTSIVRLGSLLNDHKRTYSDPSVLYTFNFHHMEEIISSWEQLKLQLEGTELPQAREKWKKFFDQILIDSVKDTLNEIKIRLNDISDSINSINEVLKLTNFEELPGDERYLQIVAQTSVDDRIRHFKRTMKSLESVLGTRVRLEVEGQSQMVMSVLVPFVEEFQNQPAYRNFVTDVRNHFQFQVKSLQRSQLDHDPVMEIFTGARKDAKSSAQTTQLAYALLASSLAYRFRFHDPVGGQDTLRLIVLDEFGGKFDNEKPREIVKLFDKMGFQSILLSPMSKADLLAESIGQMILVHKLSAHQSKVASFEINSIEDYHELLSIRNQQLKTNEPQVLTNEL